MSDFNNLIKMIEVPISVDMQSKEIEIIKEIDTISDVEFPNEILPVKNSKIGEVMKINTVSLEQFDIPEDIEVGVEDISTGSLKIGIIGAGQCGGRIAEAFFRLGYTKNISINTTTQDTNIIPTKLIFNIPNKPGGAGKNMIEAGEAFVTHKDKLYNEMTRVFGKVDHIFVCAGLGGGSGAGTIVQSLELAKKYMNYIGYDEANKRVGAIVTLPTVGEAASPIVATNAFKKGQELSTLADAGLIMPLIIIDNDKIKNLYRGLTIANFYPTINDTIAQMFNIFNQISSMSSEYVTFDATDFITLLQCGGHMTMGVTVVKDFAEKTSISDALKMNLTKTLLASDFDLTTAKAAAVIAVVGKTLVETSSGLMDNIEYGFDTIASLTGNAAIHRGIYADDESTGVRVYTVISGLTKPAKRYTRLEKK
jgi:cell division GTPase FtsZ